MGGVCKGKTLLNFSDYFGLPLGIMYTRHLMTIDNETSLLVFEIQLRKWDKRSNNNSDLETIVPFVSHKTCSDRLDDIQS